MEKDGRCIHDDCSHSYHYHYDNQYKPVHYRQTHGGQAEGYYAKPVSL
jgi:hypothetical protein